MSASTHVSSEDVPPQIPPSEREAQIAALTGLRGFAALMVVLVHVSALTAYSWVGLPSYGPVSLFVLSGYLLYRPWARWTLHSGPRPRLATFARRRLARIFPAYLLVLLAVTAVHTAARPTGADDWVGLSTLTWIYPGDQFPISFAHTWSLATELSWYLALPVLAVVTGLVARWVTDTRTPRAGLGAAVAMLLLALPISVAWRLWVADRVGETTVPYSLWLPGFLACFAGGALVALLVEAGRTGLAEGRGLRRMADDPWGLVVLAVAAALVGTSALGGPAGFPDTFAQEQVRLVCATVVAIALLLVAAIGSADVPLNRVLSTRAAGAVGRWSYGLFLWHFPLLVLLEEKIDYPGGWMGFAMRLLLVLGLSLPLSAATYFWVERPAIAWSQRRRPAGTTSPTMAASATAAQPASPKDAERPRAAGGS